LDAKGSTLTTSRDALAIGSQDEIAFLFEDGNTVFPTIDGAIEFSGDNALMTFSADGSLLASASSSGEITIFQYQDGKFIKLSSFIKDQAFSLGLHPQNNLLAVGTTRAVYFIDVASGSEVARISHPDTVNGLAFSTDGNRLVTASSEKLQFWEMSDLRPISSSDLVATACLYVYENFSPIQWKNFFGGEPYQPLCEDLPTSQ
jgi:WD40 repeat protein